MKIGVIGRGFVGGAITNGFENQGHEVLVHDTKLLCCAWNDCAFDTY